MLQNLPIFIPLLWIIGIALILRERKRRNLKVIPSISELKHNLKTRAWLIVIGVILGLVLATFMSVFVLK